MTFTQLRSEEETRATPELLRLWPQRGKGLESRRCIVGDAVHSLVSALSAAVLYKNLNHGLDDKKNQHSDNLSGQDKKNRRKGMGRGEK